MQGINDLVTPFLAVFLSEHCSGSIDDWDLSTVQPERMLEVDRWLDRLNPALALHVANGADSSQRADDEQPASLTFRCWLAITVCARTTPAAGFHSCCQSALGP